MLQRGFHGLYRWYCDRSQTQRNWNPDRSFDWRSLRTDLPASLVDVIEGFYAVEQYAPDYTAELTKLTRTNYGQSHFQMRWGAEEERHADLWRNTLLFSRQRTPEQIETYTDDLRKGAWTLPFETPVEMLLYTVLQERATQLNYQRLRERALAFGDDVLASACRTIAIDEAAHYDFFLQGARIHLYYFPERTLMALANVLKQFEMPAARLIPRYDAFVKVLYDEAIFGRMVYAREVVPVALKALGVTSARAIERGMRASRDVPTPDGKLRSTSLYDEMVDHSLLEEALIKLFDRIGDYEAEIGLDEIHPTVFVSYN